MPISPDQKILDDFQTAVTKTCPAGSRLLISYSGGSDSTALCELICQLTKKIPYKVYAVYVNHNLRENSILQQEIALIKQNCSNWHFPLEILTIEPGRVREQAVRRKKGLEEAARFLRHGLLKDISASLDIDFVLTGHTLDDRAETVLMRLLNGSSLASAGGISVISGKLFRPLLAFTKLQLVEFLRLQNVRYFEDHTNFDESNLRSRMRKDLIPVIANLFPGYTDALAGISEQLFRFGRDQKKKLESIVIVNSEIGKMNVSEIIEDFELFRAGMLKILSGFWRQARRIDKGFLKNFFRIIKEKKEISLTYQNCLVSYQFPWVTCTENVAIVPKTLYFITIPSCGRIEYNQQLIVYSSEVMNEKDSVRISGIEYPFILRSMQDGDRIPLKGISKSVRNIMKEWKVLSHDRHRLLVVEDQTGIKALLGGYCGYKNLVYYIGNSKTETKKIWLKISQWSGTSER